MTTNGNRMRDRHLVGGAAAACAVCCAAPVLALLGIAGGGLLATAVTFAFAGLAFALVVAAATVGGVLLRRRTSGRTSVAACSVPTEPQLADLGMPNRLPAGLRRDEA